MKSIAEHGRQVIVLQWWGVAEADRWRPVGQAIFVSLLCVFYVCLRGALQKSFMRKLATGILRGCNTGLTQATQILQHLNNIKLKKQQNCVSREKRNMHHNLALVRQKPSTSPTCFSIYTTLSYSTVSCSTTPLLIYPLSNNVI